MRASERPFLFSILVHVFLLGFILIFTRAFQYTKILSTEIEVIEYPSGAKVASGSVLSSKATTPVKSKREVFGVSKAAPQAATGVEVKQGNTLEKEGDQKSLRAGDADALPSAAEEYLVTRMPTLESEIRIPYPLSAKKKGVEGAVLMDLLIDASGSVREVKLVNGPDADLSDAAVKAAKDFRFKPALVQANPVAVRIRYSYKFVLEK